MCKPLAVFHGFHSRSEGEKGEKYICLNLINFRKSMRYNPLAYIRSEKDILKLVNALIMNTKGEQRLKARVASALPEGTSIDEFIATF